VKTKNKNNKQTNNNTEIYLRQFFIEPNADILLTSTLTYFGVWIVLAMLTDLIPRLSVLSFSDSTVLRSFSVAVFLSTGDFAYRKW